MRAAHNRMLPELSAPTVDSTMHFKIPRALQGSILCRVPSFISLYSLLHYLNGEAREWMCPNVHQMI